MTMYTLYTHAVYSIQYIAIYTLYFDIHSNTHYIYTVYTFAPYTDNIPRVYCVYMYFLTFTQRLVYLVKSVYSVYSDVLIIYVHCIYTYILYTNHYISIYTFDYICTVYSAYTVFISVYVLFDIHSNTHCIH